MQVSVKFWEADKQFPTPDYSRRPFSKLVYLLEKKCVCQNFIETKDWSEKKYKAPKGITTAAIGNSY